MRIFLSYASEDRSLAEEVALALGGAGHDVFFDRSSLPAGGDFHSRIQAAIDRADLCVFLASANSLRNGAYTLTELKLAREKWPHPEGHVLPVCLPGTTVGALPPYLTSVTVLEPEGNVAAEVLVAVRALQPLTRTGRGAMSVKVFAIGIVIFALGVGSWLWRSANNGSSDMTMPQSDVPPGASVPDSDAGTTRSAAAAATNPISPPPNLGDNDDQRAAPRDAESLMRRLEAANILAEKNNRAQVIGWIALEDRRYERIAEASLAVLAGRRLRAPAMIEVIVYKYARLSGKEDEEGLPINPDIDSQRIALALVQSFNENNGGPARTLDEISEP